MIKRQALTSECRCVLPLRLRWIQLFTATFILVLVHSSNGAAQSPFQTNIQFVPPPPPTIGVPQSDGRGAGSRGPSCKRYEKITPLVPFTRTATQPIRWGLTTVEHPTMWFYAPEGLAANMSLEFVLQDEAGQNRSRTVVQTSNVPAGIFRLAFPATAAPLQAGKRYSWALSIYCDSDAIDIPIRVQGSIQRVVSSSGLQRQLDATHNPLEQAKLYAKKGIWYDALTAVGEHLRQGKDTETVTVWKALLQQAGLTGIATSTIVPCCTVD